MNFLLSGVFQCQIAHLAASKIIIHKEMQVSFLVLNSFYNPLHPGIRQKQMIILQQHIPKGCFQVMS